MEDVIGVCSLCGGDVVGYTGIWMSVTPPPPARCTSCGATQARGPVIDMVPPKPQPQGRTSWETTWVRTDSNR